MLHTRDDDTIFVFKNQRIQPIVVLERNKQVSTMLHGYDDEETFKKGKRFERSHGTRTEELVVQTHKLFAIQIP